MGPMKDEPWVRDSDGPRGAHTGSQALVYALSFFFVWMILTFFVALRMGRRNLWRARTGRAGVSVVVMVAYAILA
jgi:C4-dicarboxylate transporter DctM subunit